MDHFQHLFGEVPESDFPKLFVSFLKRFRPKARSGEICGKLGKLGKLVGQHVGIWKCMDMYGNIQKYMDIMICFKRLFSFLFVRRMVERWIRKGHGKIVWWIVVRLSIYDVNVICGGISLDVTYGYILTDLYVVSRLIGCRTKMW